MRRRGMVRRTALVKGPLGGSRNWTIVWGVLLGLRLFKRFTGEVPEVVYRGQLEPGGTLVIRNGERTVRVLGAEVDVTS